MSAPCDRVRDAAIFHVMVAKASWSEDERWGDVSLSFSLLMRRNQTSSTQTPTNVAFLFVTATIRHLVLSLFSWSSSLFVFIFYVSANVYCCATTLSVKEANWIRDRLGLTESGPKKLAKWISELKSERSCCRAAYCHSTAQEDCSLL